MRLQLHAIMSQNGPPGFVSHFGLNVDPDAHLPCVCSGCLLAMAELGKAIKPLLQAAHVSYPGVCRKSLKPACDRHLQGFDWDLSSKGFLPCCAKEAMPAGVPDLVPPHLPSTLQEGVEICKGSPCRNSISPLLAVAACEQILRLQLHGV